MFTSTTETTEIIQNLIILNDQVVSLSNIKNVNKWTETEMIRGHIRVISHNINISYHNDVDKVTLVYKDEDDRETDFEDILLCLGLGDSV